MHITSTAYRAHEKCASLISLFQPFSPYFSYYVALTPRLRDRAECGSYSDGAVRRKNRRVYAKNVPSDPVSLGPGRGVRVAGGFSSVGGAAVRAVTSG